MSNPAPNSTPSSIANSSTPNQVQVLDDGFILKSVKKFDDTGFYNVYFPDGSQFQHMIFGPSDGRVVFDNIGNIRIKAGQKTKERGPGSGKILTHSNGIQCRNEGKGIFTFNANEGEDKVALSVSAYGDYDEETSGQRTINAESILLEAPDITIKAGSNITFQAGEAGGGTITFAAGSITTKANNKSDQVSGRVESVGAGETTEIKFDPRASTNIISTGAINNKIVGDEKVEITGISHKTVVGGPGQLIKDRTVAIKLLAVAGNIDITTPAIVNVKGATIFLN